MSRYIDADELIFFGLDNPDDEHLFEFVPKEFIDNAPTKDVVEVVRCRDCKHGEIDDEDFPELYLCRYHGSSWNEGNHFCSYGERGEDDKGRNTTSV